jgi:lysophospholipase L1-like esterase
VGTALGGATHAADAADAAPSVGAGVYVAMGDSFAAGVGLQPELSPLCGRSAQDYGNVVARKLEFAEFRDVTCGAAQVRDFSAPQVGAKGSVPPQYDALTPDTTLVTVGIGGNDVGIPLLAIECSEYARTVLGSCADPNSSFGGVRYIQRIQNFADTYGQVIEEIHRRAPHAEIVMIGYPTGIRPGGCPNIHPILPAEADYLEARIEQLDVVMAKEAAEHGARYLDLLPSTREHDACAAPPQRWMEGLATMTPGRVPLHPTEKSHANTAEQLLKLIRASR